MLANVLKPQVQTQLADLALKIVQMTVMPVASIGLLSQYKQPKMKETTLVHVNLCQ
jgi:hypothetical protein